MQIFMKMRTIAGFAATVAALTAAPAFAHHAGAMFDKDKNATLEGTVREFEWTNPHGWVQLMVRNPATGKEVEWSLELNSVNRLVRNGWTKSSLKAGDRAAAVIHPLRDGTNGGQLISITVGGHEMLNGVDGRPAG
jgi:hypothetical protein